MCNDELLLVDTTTMRWERGTIRRPEIDRSEIIGLLERNERKGLYLSDWDREVLSVSPPHTRPWRFSVRAALAVREGTRPCAVSPGELEADAAPNYPTPLPEAGAPRVGEFSAHRRD